MAGGFFQLPDSFFCDLLLIFGKIVDCQGIGKTPVNKLTACIKGINTDQEKIEQFPEGNAGRIVIDPDGFPVTGFLQFYVFVTGIDFGTAGVAADDLQNTFLFPEGGRDAPEAAACEVCCFV